MRWSPATSARFDIALRRLRNVLNSHTVATDRILEQKIADAGPPKLRVDPHILTVARNALVSNGDIVRLERAGSPWYHLSTTNPDFIADRLGVLEPLHRHTCSGSFNRRLGQTLEIACYRAFGNQRLLTYLGAFTDLEQHDDSTLYSKTEPPNALNGLTIGKRNLDFIAHTQGSIYGGIEIKNIRQWIYPARDEIREMLLKCCTLDIVPVLIGRRIHFSTFSVLHPCGVLLHQTFNQLYPASEAAFAAQVRGKDLLGYHDVRLGNTPDPRLTAFITKHLPVLLPSARVRFDAFKDLPSATLKASTRIQPSRLASNDECAASLRMVRRWKRRPASLSLPMWTMGVENWSLPEPKGC